MSVIAAEKNIGFILTVWMFYLEKWADTSTCNSEPLGTCQDSRLGHMIRYPKNTSPQAIKI